MPFALTQNLVCFNREKTKGTKKSYIGAIAKKIAIAIANRLSSAADIELSQTDKAKPLRRK